MGNREVVETRDGNRRRVLEVRAVGVGGLDTKLGWMPNDSRRYQNAVRPQYFAQRWLTADAATKKQCVLVDRCDATG
jgi:hypothetical protein